jgi:hypothetical protein
MTDNKDYERAQIKRVRDAENVESYAVQIDARHADGTTSTKWLNITREEMLDIGRVIVGDALAIRVHMGEGYKADY